MPVPAAADAETGPLAAGPMPPRAARRIGG